MVWTGKTGAWVRLSFWRQWDHKGDKLCTMTSPDQRDRPGMCAVSLCQRMYLLILMVFLREASYPASLRPRGCLCMGERGLSSLWHGLNEKQPVQDSRLSTSSIPVTNAGKEYVSKEVNPWLLQIENERVSKILFNWLLSEHERGKFKGRINLKTRKIEIKCSKLCRFFFP